MASPVGHLFGGLGAYLAATGPRGASKLRGGGMLAVVLAMALMPDAVQLTLETGPRALLQGGHGPQVVAAMHGVLFGAVLAMAMAGAIPAFRKAFWAAALVLLAGHASHGLLDALSLAGVPLLAPFESRAFGFGLAILPSADARILRWPFLSALKVMMVEIGILGPLVWTAWILGREGGAAKSRAWLTAFALSWPLAAGLAIWSVRNRGAF